eukprot:c11138_g1_i1.p1 GENE.c11138_g1_i1~~c11138_g1_i1.p1  ORF type:complete len:216 (-),score=55.66 c11138_g1_i1:321-926(-)
MVGGGETAAIVVTVFVVLIVLAIMRYLAIRRQVPHILDEEEIAFKRREEGKIAKRKRTKKRAKKDFEDRRTLLEDYDEVRLDTIDDAVLNSIDVTIDDADIDELENIVSAASSKDQMLGGGVDSSANASNRARPRVIRQSKRSTTHTGQGKVDRLDDDDDLELQLTAPSPSNENNSSANTSTSINNTNHATSNSNPANVSV